MSKILEAMQKSAAARDGDFDRRLKAVDKGNLFPLPDAQLTREFEQLATSLIHMHTGDGGEIVVFASTNPGEGTSFVSYNCARIMTLMLDRQIAWVDGNFAAPSTKLQQSALNLRDLLVDPDSLRPAGEGAELVVVANGSRSVKSMQMLNSENYDRLIRRFQERFYFTFIDGPPVLGSVEVAPMAQKAMGLVLVVESQRLKHEVIQHGIEKLRSQGVNVLGTVLNKRVFQLPEFLYRRL